MIYISTLRNLNISVESIFTFACSSGPIQLGFPSTQEILTVSSSEPLAHPTSQCYSVVVTSVLTRVTWEVSENNNYK